MFCVFLTFLHKRGSACTNSLDRADLASESQGCVNSWSECCIDSDVVAHDSCGNCMNSQNRVANANSRCSVDLADDVNESSACSREGDHSWKVVSVRGRSHPIVDVRDSLNCTSVKNDPRFPHDVDEHGDCSV